MSRKGGGRREKVEGRREKESPSLSQEHEPEPLPEMEAG